MGGGLGHRGVFLQARCNTASRNGELGRCVKAKVKQQVLASQPDIDTSGPQSAVVKTLERILRLLLEVETLLAKGAVGLRNYADELRLDST